MTDAALLAKRLAFIETCLRDLRENTQPDVVTHRLGDLDEFVTAVRHRMPRD